MAQQRTLLDGDTGAKFESTELLVGQALAGGGGVSSVTAGDGLADSGTAADPVLNVGANPDGSIVVGADTVGVGVLATDAQHGSRGGGTQHTVASGASAGFMSAADKTKLDALPAAVTETEWLPTQEVLAASTTTEPTADVFVGGSFLLTRRVSFNRVALRVAGIGAAATAQGRFAIYQHPDGHVDNAVPLALAFDFDATDPPGSQNVVVAVAPTILAPGICWALWGRRAGANSWDAVTYAVDAVSNSLLAQNVVAGTHPVSFTTAIASTAAAPATFNPLEGGDAVGSTGDDPPVWRVFTA